MPRNTHRSTASQARKRTPTTLRLRLSKPPVPDVPDNDENPTDDEKEDKEEEEEETQSEDPRFLRTPTPEPEISFKLYERVIINRIKEPIKIKLRNVTTNDMTVSFYHIQYTAKRIAEDFHWSVRFPINNPGIGIKKSIRRQRRSNLTICQIPLYHPAKSPQIHEISDDEKLPPTHTRSTATSQQLKKAQN
ncbi:predicted protein [Histoplasma mississippiense (nom. inval.)]|uniref:predicted protein n=1 Tax=Ajellomyces capsulatus (strain NAm1 / WU24) TaxID=2059318 RepID=UPI000157CA88|nr:predicted protein [Histoplasma mississippiense (nom. inval.)]XP_001539319.1 predicted protein [Histoplasma mississippiense (nom. inval.)]EDN09757.1 predicted protein [Histoplasma mississippiense (nom. inval.)]EDN11257.1 predicted protein [Histoplasma mississippiense (nom. inval.)]